MMLSERFLVALTLVPLVASRDGLHLATDGLLQIPPSFSGKGIALFPAHHPDHEPADLEHVTPSVNQELYYTQEGHRPAVHGAKHGSIKAVFNRPTVVLDHTSHLTSIDCRPGSINVCFSREAYQQAEKTWQQSPELHLITYHVGCGDETTGTRSVFLAQQPRFDPSSGCVSANTTLIEKEAALASGEIAWGTYQYPVHAKRTPVKGHVRASVPAPASTSDDDTAGIVDQAASVVPGLVGTGDDSSLSPPLKPDAGGTSPNVDITEDAGSLDDFFGLGDIDASHIHDLVSADEDLDFIEPDGEVGDEDEEKNGQQRRALLGPRRIWSARLQKRGIVDFFEGVYDGAKKLVKAAADFVETAVDVVVKAAETVVKIAIVAANLIAVPFGVPFDHSYHNDFNFTHHLRSDSSTTNRPPPIFGDTDGFNLAGSGTIFNVQCTKCGIHADFSVDGRLAFGIKDGITEGSIALNNHDAFTIDAVFGITIEANYNKPLKGFEKEIFAAPLSPLTIPGIVTIGPELSMNVAMDMDFTGYGEFLLGGSLSIDSGTAMLSLVRQKDNKLVGFSTKFTPVAQFNGSLSASIEMGLPIALDCGIDVLSGKFKKTVGLVNKPSVYGAASITTDSKAKCANGIELRAGIKNRIYIHALKSWDYDIRTDVLYEKSIACVTASGFDTKNVRPDTSVFKKVTDAVGADVSAVKPPIKDVAANLTRHHGAGFRIIMDEKKESILVAGTDGYIYLVPTKDAYDISSPWGTVDVKSSAVNLDVFGRIMAYTPDTVKGHATEIRLYEPNQVPKKTRAGALLELKTDEKTYGAYAVFLRQADQDFIYYPTFCAYRSKGLRLVPTRFIMDKDKRPHAATDADVVALGFGLSNLGALGDGGCATVRLTSTLD